jgi:hypothetical protein
LGGLRCGIVGFTSVRRRSRIASWRSNSHLAA